VFRGPTGMDSRQAVIALLKSSRISVVNATRFSDGLSYVTVPAAEAVYLEHQGYHCDVSCAI
jgi:hypothetical protein